MAFQGRAGTKNGFSRPSRDKERLFKAGSGQRTAIPDRAGTVNGLSRPGRDRERLFKVRTGTGMEKTRRGLARWTDIIENQIQTINDVRLEDVENAFSHITEETDKGLFGLCHFYMAYYDVKHGRMEESLECLKESVRCMVGTDQEKNLARCYNMLGVIAHSQNSLLMASEQYDKALTYAERYGDSSVRNIVLSNMADMYYRIGSYKKAFQCFRESMEEYDRQGRDGANSMWNYMILLANYGYCLTMTQRLSEASEVAHKLADMRAGDYGDQFPDLYAYTFFALLCHKLERREEASESLAMALQAVMDKKRLASDYDAVLNLLELLILMEQFDSLEKALDVVEGFAREEHNNGLMLNLLVYRLKYCSEGLSRDEYMEYAGQFFRLREDRGESESALVIHMMEMNRRLWSIEQQQKELELANTRLLYQVDHDELSGLYNKGYLNRYLEEAFLRAKKDRLSLSVVFVDIDHFKQLNDRYGHRKGDECIRAVADAIGESMPEDFAARYGGDEFVAVAVGRTSDHIKKAAEGIVENVKKRQIPNLDSSVSDILSVTVGLIHAVPCKGDRVWDFLAAADQALYCQKTEKKGLVRFKSSVGTGL